MDIKQRQLIKKYVDLVTHKWWLIAASVLVTVTAGLGYYLSLPKIYQSTSLLSYEQQQINSARMDPEHGKIKLQEALANLKELVTSRNSLEKVITQFSLYEEDRKRLPIDDVIISMRKDIVITPAASQSDIFSVSFQGVDPQKVLKVTNALASLFIEENLKYQEVRATETSKYTQNELAKAKKVLDEKDQLMRDYKLKNFNEMPEQRQNNIARVQALSDHNQAIQNSIQELERTRILAQEQIGMHQRMAATRIASESSVGAGNASARQPETDADRLRRLRGYLNELLGKYTEKHPEVQRTKQLIEQLEKQVGKEQSANRYATVSVPHRSNPSESNESQRLQLQLKGIDGNIKQLRADQALIPAEMTKYQKWVEAAPVREAEWNELTRDYNELRHYYDQLVVQNLQAESAENIEHIQKGSRFKIVDPARLPQKPFKPNFLNIFLKAIVAGLALSFGSILGLDLMDTSFKDVGEIEEYLGVPVLCAIAYIEKDTETRKERLWFLMSITVVSICSAVLLVAIVYLWIKGIIIIGGQGPANIPK